MAISFPTNPQPVVDDQYVESDPPQNTDNQYTFQGTEYRYESLNNRWLAQQSGGASVTVSQIPPANASDGDLWWYCGADDEDPSLFTYVDDATGVGSWIQSSPGIAFESSSGGGGGGLIFTTELITTSDAAWSPKFDGTFTFIAVGSGGTGGVISLDDGGSSGATRAAYSNSGGGAAGVATLTVNGLTSQTYDITIAASATNTITDRTQVGGPGNDTTITGNGVDITAGAGQGGTVTVRATSAGGIGGTATGGDTNIPGGAADDATSGGQTVGGIIFSGIMPGNGADTNELNGFGGGGGGNYISRDGRPSAATSTSEPGAVLVLYQA